MVHDRATSRRRERPVLARGLRVDRRRQNPRPTAGRWASLPSRTDWAGRVSMRRPMTRTRMLRRALLGPMAVVAVAALSVASTAAAAPSAGPAAEAGTPTGNICEQAIAQAGSGKGTYGKYRMVKAPGQGGSGSGRRHGHERAGPPGRRVGQRRAVRPRRRRRPRGRHRQRLPRRWHREGHAARRDRQRHPGQRGGQRRRDRQQHGHPGDRPGRSSGAAGHLLVHAAHRARRDHRRLPGQGLRPADAGGGLEPQHLRRGLTRWRAAAQPGDHGPVDPGWGNSRPGTRSRVRLPLVRVDPAGLAVVRRLLRERLGRLPLRDDLPGQRRRVHLHGRDEGQRLRPPARLGQTHLPERPVRPAGRRSVRQPGLRLRHRRPAVRLQLVRRRLVQR